jgi:uncharacterized protein (DUF58 family)
MAAPWLVLRRLLTLLAVVLFLVAWNRGLALLYAMFAFVVGTLVTAWMAPKRMLRGIDVLRHHPSHITAGEALPMTFDIYSQSRWRRYMVEIWDQVPCAPETERQPRLFLPQVRGRLQAAMQVACERRGVFTLGPLTLYTGYPLGIRAVQRRLPASTAEVVVYPRTFPIRHFAPLQRSPLVAVGQQAVTRLGSSAAFVGVREYRTGDSRRHIHWPSSARHGTLIVKAYEGFTTASLGIVLDLHQHNNYGIGQHSTLEYAVTIAASLAQYALAHGYRVGVFGHGQTRLRLMPESGRHQMPAILDALARVQADGTVPYAEAMHQARYQMHPDSVLLLFHNPAPNVPGASRPILEDRSFYGTCVVVRFHTASFLSKAPDLPPPLSPRSPYHYVIRCGDDLAQAFAR